MNKTACLIYLVIFIFSSSFALGADKVVVIPLKTSGAVQKKDWINFSPYSASPVGSTAINASGIKLNDTDPCGFTQGFILPPNYKKGTTISFYMIWSTEDLNTNNCFIKFVPYSIVVTRPGKTHLVSVKTGLTIEGGTILSAPLNSEVHSQEIKVTITSPQAGTELEPGNGLLFGFMRNPIDLNDTCPDDMVIHGLSATYETQ